MPRKRHHPHIDLLKGVIIFLVVVGHAFHFGFGYYRSVILMALRAMDMPIFLFLSGMLASGAIAFDRSSSRAYWLKKSRQLLLPLITLPSLYALLYHIPTEEMVWGMMHGGYWFTLVLFEAFVLLWCVRLGNHRLNPEGKPLVELLLLATSIGLVLAIDNLWRPLGDNLYTALSWSKTSQLYPYFVLGYTAGRYRLWHTWLTSAWVHALALVGFVLLIYAEQRSGAVLGGVPASLAGLIGAYATAYRLRDRRGAIPRLIIQLGKESRTIYLTHYFFLFSAPMVKPFLLGLPPGGRLMLWGLMLAGGYALIVVAVTWGAVVVIKSSPLLNLLCYGKQLKASS